MMAFVYLKAAVIKVLATKWLQHTVNLVQESPFTSNCCLSNTVISEKADMMTAFTLPFQSQPVSCHFFHRVISLSPERASNLLDMSLKLLFMFDILWGYLQINLYVCLTFDVFFFFFSVWLQTEFVLGKSPYGMVGTNCIQVIFRCCKNSVGTQNFLMFSSCHHALIVDLKSSLQCVAWAAPSAKEMVWRMAEIKTTFNKSKLLQSPGGVGFESKTDQTQSAFCTWNSFSKWGVFYCSLFRRF